MTYKPPCVERHSASVLSPRDKDARARSCGHIRDVMLWRTRTHALSMPSQRHGRPYINFEWKNWDISVLSPLTPNTSRSLNALFTGRSCTRLTGVATRSIFDLGLIVQKLVYTLSWYKNTGKKESLSNPKITIIFTSDDWWYHRRSLKSRYVRSELYNYAGLTLRCECDVIGTTGGFWERLVAVLGNGITL